MLQSAKSALCPRPVNSEQPGKGSMKIVRSAPFYAVDSAEYLFVQITEQVHPGLGICISNEGRPQCMLCERLQLG